MLEKAFNRAWPELEEQLGQIAAEHPPKQPPPRKIDDKVNEILKIARQLKQTADDAEAARQAAYAASGSYVPLGFGTGQTLFPLTRSVLDSQGLQPGASPQGPGARSLDWGLVPEASGG